MNERNNQARGASEWEDTYGSLGMTPRAQLLQLPLHILDPWQSTDGSPQPFKAYSPEKLRRFADNIRENGVIEPISVRPMANGRFQIIAGHNRVEASRLAGKTVIPALMQQLDDHKAYKLMIDSNFQHRDTILPSEKARAYDGLIRDMRHRGKRTHLTSDNDCPKFPEHDMGSSTSDNDCPKSPEHDMGNSTSDNDCPKCESAWSHQVVADEYGVSATSVKQHLRLLQLRTELLDMVDNGAAEKNEQDPGILPLSFVAGYEVSFLKEAEQEMLLSVMHDLEKAPTPAQAKRLHQESKGGTLDEATILSILNPKKEKKAELKTKVDLSAYDPETAKRLRKDPQYLAGLQAVILSYTAKYVNQSDFEVT